MGMFATKNTTIHENINKNDCLVRETVIFSYNYYNYFSPTSIILSITSL